MVYCKQNKKKWFKVGRLPITYNLLGRHSAVFCSTLPIQKFRHESIALKCVLS